MSRRPLPAVQIRAGVLLVLALLVLAMARVPERRTPAPLGHADVDPPLPATGPR